MHSNEPAQRSARASGDDDGDDILEETDIASDEEMDGDVDAEGAGAIERRND